MKNLLVIYHEDFLCYEKLKRKIKNITINMDDFKITTTHDKRGILLRLSTEITFELNIVKEVKLNDISHSIIFNCFNEYDEIITEIKEKNIPIRIINLKLAKAINIKGTNFGKGSSETYEYIGRGSKWGNPYSMYENDDDCSYGRLSLGYVLLYRQRLCACCRNAAYGGRLAEESTISGY